MKDVVEKLGQNAGKIWETLSTHGSLTQTQLMKNCKLEEKDFHAAVGWLARENKIREEDSTYVLGETNLTSRIGENAGKVWKVLDTVGEIDLEYVPKLIGVTEKDVFAAVGWLAREGKIKTKKVKPRKPRLKLVLKK